MSNIKLFKDNIGVVFRAYAGIDISNATSIILRVRKPSATKQAWTSSLASDNNYYATYSTVSGDLNETGEYLISLEVITVDGRTVTGKSDSFVVYDQFYDIDPPNRYLNIY